MAVYPDNPPPDVAKKREALSRMFSTGQYDRAADLALFLGNEVTMFTPIESIADHILKKRPQDAQKLYAVALAHARTYASWATSGGEGLSRMEDVHALEAKLKRSQKTR